MAFLNANRKTNRLQNSYRKALFLEIFIAKKALE